MQARRWLETVPTRRPGRSSPTVPGLTPSLSAASSAIRCTATVAGKPARAHLAGHRPHGSPARPHHRLLLFLLRGRPLSDPERELVNRPDPGRQPGVARPACRCLRTVGRSPDPNRRVHRMTIRGCMSLAGTTRCTRAYQQISRVKRYSARTAVRDGSAAAVYAFRFGAHAMSQDRKWEVVHTALLCTVHPQMVPTRSQHVLVDNRRIGAGRRTVRHGMTAVGAAERRGPQFPGCAGFALARGAPITLFW